MEPWTEQRLHSLRSGTGKPVHPLDLSDDRLAAVLEVLSHDEHWQAFEGALTQQLLRVYDLQPERVRLDSTTASWYWSVTEDRLFQFGHSKDHRPDLAQGKVMLSALDSLGLPVATDAVPGQRANDPLYIPGIAQVRESVGQRGRLYVGNSKMGALETRAFIQAGGDAYRCPLAEVKLPSAVLEDYLAPARAGHQPLTRLTRLSASGKRVPIADGYERLEPLTSAVAGEAFAWTERRLVVRWCQLARAGGTALRTRLAKAQAAVATALGRLGWLVYATNAPPEQLALSQVVLAYRSQYLVEGDMGRLKGHPLSLTPMYLERDDHATGLIRLLSVGLRVLSLLEFLVHQRLAAVRTVLAGLFVGNPKWATARPTTERLLKRFEGLTLTIIREGRRRRSHLTPLSRVQRRILTLLNFPVDIYMRLCPDSPKLP